MTVLEELIMYHRDNMWRHSRSMTMYSDYLIYIEKNIYDLYNSIGYRRSDIKFEVYLLPFVSYVTNTNVVVQPLNDLTEKLFSLTELEFTRIAKINSIYVD